MHRAVRPRKYCQLRPTTVHDFTAKKRDMPRANRVLRGGSDLDVIRGGCGRVLARAPDTGGDEGEGRDEEQR